MHFINKNRTHSTILRLSSTSAPASVLAPSVATGRAKLLQFFPCFPVAACSVEPNAMTPSVLLLHGGTVDEQGSMHTTRDL